MINHQKGFIGLLGLLAAVLIIGLLFLVLNRYVFSPAGRSGVSPSPGGQNIIDQGNDLKNRAEDLDKQREDQIKDLENLDQ